MVLQFQNYPSPSGAPNAPHIWLCLWELPHCIQKAGTVLHPALYVRAVTCTERAFIRTAVEDFYIDALTGGSFATVNNRSMQLIINESTEKKSQVRISSYMTLRERKERVLLQNYHQSRQSITCKSLFFMLTFPH